MRRVPKENIAVDIDGNPLVLFHGTPSAFDAFNFSLGLPFFTTSKDWADRFGEATMIKRGLSGPVRVIEAHVIIRNPLRPDQLALDFNGDVGAAQSAGYDGLVDVLREETRYLPFSPDQIEVLAPENDTNKQNEPPFAPPRP